MSSQHTQDIELKRIIRIVAILNLAYFFVEFGSALVIGSVSLFADGIDFLEDACVNFLILAALGWSLVRRARVGMLLSGILLIPGLAALLTAWQKISMPVAPAPLPLSLVGGGAFIINLSCSFMLARFRSGSGSMVQAAFLSARNDVFANVAIVTAGIVTVYVPNAWPDLIVGLGIAVMNFGAAREVYEAAHKESH